MTAFESLNPISFSVAWCLVGLLWAAAARLGVQFATRLPFASPTDLDTYGLACLAGGPMRLRDAALAAVAVRTARGSDADSERPPAGHNLEVAIGEAATREAEWAVCWARAGTYRAELVRLGLLHDPRRLWALAPAAIIAAAMMAGCILSLVFNNPPGRPPGSIELTLVSVFGLCGTIFLFGLLDVGRVSRRGLDVLRVARAQHEGLRPRNRTGILRTPAEAAIGVALFGLREWSSWPPLSQLFDRLYPPTESAGGN